MSGHTVQLAHVNGGVRAECSCGWFAFRIAHRPGHTEDNAYEAARVAANAAGARHVAAST